MNEKIVVEQVSCWKKSLTRLVAHVSLDVVPDSELDYLGKHMGFKASSDASAFCDFFTTGEIIRLYLNAGWTYLGESVERWEFDPDTRWATKHTWTLLFSKPDTTSQPQMKTFAEAT